MASSLGPDPNRRVGERDCTRPAAPDSGNLRCT
jgi:hypothetical protein